MAIDGASTIAMAPKLRFACTTLMPPSPVVAAATFAVAAVLLPELGLADEGGTSFWIPGSYGSMAAVPPPPGWSLTIVNEYNAATAGGDVAAAREITIGRLSSAVTVNLNANYKSSLDTFSINPTYAFATPIFGGTLELGATASVAATTVGINGTLTVAAGPFVAVREGSISSSIFGVGDVQPTAQLYWNSGVNNWTTYLTGGIPVGTYNSSSLANIGIGHGAVDGGAGYTFYDPKSGREFSVVTGLTYNLVNPSTDYQSGIDWHLDWGLSQTLTKAISVGAVGYAYDQITGDSGAGDHLGAFESRVFGIGPQVGYSVAAGSLQANLNLKAYWEFEAAHRPSGWNAWATLTLSPNAPAPGKPVLVK